MESQTKKNLPLENSWKKYAEKIATGEERCFTTRDAFERGWNACAAFYDGETEAKFELFTEEKPSWQASAADIYAAYPKKVGRAAAIKAIEKALKIRSASYLLDATKAYNSAVSRWEIVEQAYIPHPSTWFNQGRYDDDRSTWIRQPKLPGYFKPQMRLHESQIKCS